MKIKNVKSFNMIPTDFVDYTSYNTEIGRFYKIGDQAYPSVTTVLGINTDLSAWRARVGEEEAKKISTQATKKGSYIHEMCEYYLRGKINEYPHALSPHHWYIFNEIKKVLDKYVDNIRGIEVPLYSHYLKIGGRTDLIAEFDGKLSIIDFKTSFKTKQEKYVENYFLQTSAYCVMSEETLQLPIRRTVVIIAPDDEEVQLFVKRRDDYIHKFIEVRKQFKEKFDV